MPECQMPKRFVECREIKEDAVECKGMIRFYRNGPGSFSLQIRSTGGIGKFGSGKPRKMISTVSVTVEDLEEMLAYARANA